MKEETEYKDLIRKMENEEAGCCPVPEAPIVRQLSDYCGFTAAFVDVFVKFCQMVLNVSES